MTALIGLILGIIAMTKVKQSRGVLGGGGIALAGVIMSGIFLLMALLFATFSIFVGVPHAYRITCISNVKGLSIAMRKYTDDNQNHYPAATNWCDALLRSDAGMTNAFHCPADSSGGRCSYAFNAKVAGAEVGKVDPNTVMFFEANGGWNLSGGKELLLAKPRHDDQVMVGFVDGHVEEVPESRRSQLRWEP